MQFGELCQRTGRQALFPHEPADKLLLDVRVLHRDVTIHIGMWSFK